MEANDDDDAYIWKPVIEPNGRTSHVVFTKPKTHLEGWVMQHDDGTWIARTVKGVRGEFETEDDARSFLKLLLASNG